MNMLSLEILAAKQACTDLVSRTARAIDRCDAQLLKAQFHEDAHDDHGSFKGSIDEFVAWVIPVLHSMEHTQHFIGQILIEVDGDSASGESYFIAQHALKQDGNDQQMVAAGRYLDTFECRDGVWKISSRTAVYDWNSNVRSSDGWDREAPGDMQFGRRGNGDASYGHFC
ncbi:nuclear transport factor 2 family protein [Parasphingorhabdus sp.]|uniref:nuclear transport factor 2 family protein n=1 Tax=Parasphingorhabdus sp. TaxID=2709688 RepID=UPI0032630DF9